MNVQTFLTIPWGKAVRPHGVSGKSSRFEPQNSALSLPAFIARRIAFNRERTFSRFIIRIALAATALSVAVMILATALVSGFQEAVSGKVFSFWGHIQVSRYQPAGGLLSEPPPFQGSDSLARALGAVPGVETVDAYATRSAVLKSREEIEGVVFKGVDAGYHWDHLRPFLAAGRFLHFPDSGYSAEIILSTYLANKLDIKVNDDLIVFFIQKDNAAPRARKLHVVGLYKTSIEDYDKTCVIGDLDLLRRLSDWSPDELAGYELHISDYRQMKAVSDRLYEQVLPQGLVSSTARDIYPNIFDWLHLQDMNEWIVLIIMAVVAVINMVTAVMILILERTNMVGILKSLGMEGRQIQQVFLYQAAYIVLVGLLIGNAVGLGLAFLQKTTGFFKLDEQTYYMPVAPISVHAWQVVAIDIGTLVVCVWVMILPSLMIYRVSPVKAVQFR